MATIALIPSGELKKGEREGGREEGIYIYIYVYIYI